MHRYNHYPYPAQDAYWNRPPPKSSSRSWTCKTSFLERPLKMAFGKLGEVISHHPAVFIVLPLILAIGLGCGLIFIKPVTDVEYLYTPINGPAKTERRTVEHLFKQNSSGQFSSQRLSRFDGTLTLILESSSTNILQKDSLQEVIDIDAIVKNIHVLHNNTSVKFADICSNWNGACEDNVVLKLHNRNVDILDNLTLTYPVHDRKYWLGHHLGGVSPGGEALAVTAAKAIKLEYYVRSDEDQVLADAWLAECISVLAATVTNHTKLYYYSSNSLEQELDESTISVIPLFSVTYSILITFSIVSCTILGDWVTSKPWLAFFGVLSAALAVVSAFGLMCYCQVQFASQVAVMPFLALGIGVDDMFILISAWRRTDVYSDRHRRMREAMQEAGVSITMTSLTNTLAFGIGAITSFPSIQIFCLYTGAAMLFCYFYSITFFAGFMVLFGIREEQNRHCYSWCTRCTPADSLDYRNKSWCYKIWCTGGFSKLWDSELKTTPKTPTPHFAMDFFKQYFGPFLMKPIVRVLVVLVYAGYLAIAVWGCTRVQEGLQLKNLAVDNSYVTQYYAVDDQYFSKYGPLVQVIVDEDLDYSTESVQQDISDLLRNFTAENHFTETGLVSWLDSYLNFRKLLPPTPTPDFIGTLDEFFAIPDFAQFSLDVQKNQTHILASRFFVMTEYVTTAVQEKDMMLKAREIAGRFPDLQVTVFHPAFIFFDQYTVILTNTLQNMGIAVGCMLVLSLLLLSNPVCSVWIVLAIVSIETGVLGYMTLWDVNLDSISMINLILCIGFSVDYAAHITYSFSSSPAPTKPQKSIDALYDLGFPVLQGAASTILGVVILAVSTSYIFRTFFKTMFLVILFGAFHGVVVLPVVLSVLGTSDGGGTQKDKPSDKPHYNEGHHKDKPVAYPQHQPPYYAPSNHKKHEHYHNEQQPRLTRYPWYEQQQHYSPNFEHARRPRLSRYPFYTMSNGQSFADNFYKPTYLW